MKITKGAVIPNPGNTTDNKTGSWRSFKPLVDKVKCRKCGICVRFCPEGCIDMGKELEIDYDYCKGCGICAHECPFKAIVMELEEK